MTLLIARKTAKKLAFEINCYPNGVTKSRCKICGVGGEKKARTALFKVHLNLILELRV